MIRWQLKPDFIVKVQHEPVMTQSKYMYEKIVKRLQAKRNMYKRDLRKMEEDDPRRQSKMHKIELLKCIVNELKILIRQL